LAKNKGDPSSHRMSLILVKGDTISILT